MKNHSRIILVAILLVGGMLLAASCTKEGGFDRSGQVIRFGTSNPGVTTKTEYAGKDNDVDGANNTKIEPIWWKVGDQLTIVSDLASITDKDPDVAANHKSVYQIASFITENGVVNKSKATLNNYPNPGNGLAWGDTPGEEYTFYAAYPSSVEIGYDVDAEAPALGFGHIKATIPSSQEVSAHEYLASPDGTAKDWYTITDGTDGKYYTVYEPSMQYAFMTAKRTFTPSAANFDNHGYVYKNGEDNGPEVDLTFYPAFTAFEFTFESADPDVDIDLTEFRMESTTTALSGEFSGVAGSSSFAAAQTAKKTLSLANPTVLGTIKNGAPKSFTIFAMPQELTNLTIYFADKDDNNETRTRKLEIKDKESGNPVTFAPGKKYRIKGLKFPGNKYQFFLNLDGIVQEWDVVGGEDMTTNFSEQIQCGALTFNKSAIEMTDYYYTSPTTTSGIGHTSKNNNYRSGAPVGDGRWQVRTLNQSGLDEGVDPFESLTASFVPSAPLGGYWKLDTHGNEYFKVELVTEVNPQTGAPTLTPLPEYGRIMNQTVTLQITPIWAKIAEASADTEIGLYMDCYFSTNVEFDPALDANTEFQDIHGNGKYSYWLITVAR